MSLEITCYNDTNALCLSSEICRYCVDKKAVLPSLEAFEMGIEIPALYFMFYEYFFKSSVGDTRWKKACTKDNEAFSPLGTVHAEAFAMLQLKNNYFAWLLEAKEEWGAQLITDYDEEALEEGKLSAPEVYLKKLEIDTQGDEEILVVREGCDKFADLQKRRKGKLLFPGDHDVLLYCLLPCTNMMFV